MSGGVDSSLAACLLKQKGYEVIGATMKFWPCDQERQKELRSQACCSIGGINDARAVAQKLGIAHFVFDFHREFQHEVIHYFCREYNIGLTPNPCIICNEKIKFDLFLKKADMLGCEYIATGHYAKIGYSKFSNRYYIREGKDKNKDQSYFLFSIPQRSLARTLFPLGNMTKPKSRKMAQRYRLNTHNKKSSQEVCFVPSHYSEYVAQWNNSTLKRGDILDTRGKVIGRHRGIHYYTIGQRKGIGIAGKEPLYVVSIDVRKNTITVGSKKELMKQVIIVKNPVWGQIKKIDRPLRVMGRLRYGHKKAKATVERIAAGRLRMVFDEPQQAPTPGQAVVFYNKDAVAGGGWIESVSGQDITQRKNER